MSINVQCPGCGKRYKVDDRFAGKKAKCQSCGGAIAVPAPQPQPASDDPFAAMDELEQTGTATPEPARGRAAPPPLTSAAPRRAGTVYNPALAQPTVVSSGSSGVSQGMKLVLSLGVGIVCFVLGFWAVHLLTSGAPHKLSVANNSSSGATDDRGLEATGVADIANDMSGRKARQASPPPPPQNTAPPAPADADVEAKRPAVLKPFPTPDPKQLDGKEEWLPSVPYVMTLPSDYEAHGSIVFHEDSFELKGYQSYYVKAGLTPAAQGSATQFSIIVQRRQHKKFPKVFTQATSNTKYALGPNDPLDKQLVLEGYKVEFGTIDDIASLRAVGKDEIGRDSVVYVLLPDEWFIRIELSNVPPGSPELAKLDAMVHSLHYKEPMKQ